MRLVKLRGESMQAAADAQPSGMVSVIGLSADKVGAVWAAEGLWRHRVRALACRHGRSRLDAPPPPWAWRAERPLHPALPVAPPLPPPPQVAELCEAASAEVPAGQGVRIANYLCNGNYAVSGGLAGCEAVERMAKGFKARCVRGAGAWGVRLGQRPPLLFWREDGGRGEHAVSTADQQWMACLSSRALQYRQERGPRFSETSTRPLPVPHVAPAA